jgi:transcription elongation factor Elf1
MKKEKKKMIMSCPCCGKAPTVSHGDDQEGGTATIECVCGLKVECWDDYNSYIAEEKAIRKWNKTCKTPRKKVILKRWEDEEDEEDEEHKNDENDENEEGEE